MLDYHTHTTFSDGQETLDSFIQSAISNGITELGISDHYACVPRDIIKLKEDQSLSEKLKKYDPTKIEITKEGFCDGYSMKKSVLKDYFSEISSKKEEFKDKLILKIGLELDYFPENWDNVVSLINQYPIDYIIGSVHNNPSGKWYKHICYPDTYIGMTDDEYLEFAQKNIELIIDMVNTGKSQIVAHSECVCGTKKMKDITKMYDHFSALVKAVRDNNMCIEMNCWGPEENLDPNIFIYKECGRLDIPVIITSDAHFITELKRGYVKGMKWLKEAGVKYTATYDKCQKTVKEIKY